MRTLAVSAAVVAALASAGAYAARIDVYVTGASAQRNFWNGDINNLANCNAAPNKIKWSGLGVNGFPSPDFTETACVSAGGGLLKMAVNDVLAIHYSAELGSVMGIATALGHFGQTGPAGGTYPNQPYPVNHLFLQWNAGDCSSAAETTAGSSTCGNGTIVYGLEASTAGQCANGAQGTDAMCAVTPSLVSRAPDIALADLEPTKFENAIDWPVQIVQNGLGINAPAFKALGNAPTAGNIGAINGGGTLNGQVFMIALGGVPSNPQNLSSSSIASIFQGGYTSWSALPEIGKAGDPAGTKITICRRDNGSGTQVTSNATFTGGPECGLPGVKFLEANAVGIPNVGKVILRLATSDIQTCVTAQAGSIGIEGLQGNTGIAGIVNPTIDGAQANAHNSAAGIYKYYSETWGINLSGLAAATTMLSEAKSNTALGTFPGKETATFANGTWTSAAPTGFFSLPIVGNAVANTAENVTLSPGVPNAAFTNNGDQCAVKTPKNVNSP